MMQYYSEQSTTILFQRAFRNSKIEFFSSTPMTLKDEHTAAQWRDTLVLCFESWKLILMKKIRRCCKGLPALARYGL